MKLPFVYFFFLCLFIDGSDQVSYRVITSHHSTLTKVIFEIPHDSQYDIIYFLTKYQNCIKLRIKHQFDKLGILSAKLYLESTICITKDHEDATVNEDVFFISTESKIFTTHDLSDFINFTISNVNDKIENDFN